MKPYTKRCIFRACIDISLMAIVAFYVSYWAVIVVAAYGIWNFYDGITVGGLDHDTN